MKSFQKILFIAYLFVSIHCSGQNIMVFHGDSVAIGETANVTLEIENIDMFSAFQFDMVIPGGFSYIDNSAELSDRKADHSLVVSLIGNDTLRVIAFSPSNSNFNGYTGEILQFSLNTSESPGNYNLETNNCILANNQGNNIITNVINSHVWLFVPVGTNQINTQQNFKVYPNPNNGSFNLDFLTTPYDDFLLTIHNLNGQIVLEKDLSPVANRIRVNLAELLQQTHYVLRIQTKINQELVYQQILIKH
jgi:hypothetical protein